MYLSFEGEKEFERVQKIQDFVKSEAASYKYPRVIEFVESLPKTTNGKIRRDEIRRRDAVKIYD